ncbi:Protein of unknown function [Bacillus cytotoxicus]|nr:Protein of unknown function [Bacillus cytotoxicus]
MNTIDKKAVVTVVVTTAFFLKEGDETSC